MTTITEGEALARLKAACDAEGSQKAFCAKYHLQPAVVSQVMNGRLPIPPSVLKVLGLARISMFEEKSHA